MNDCNTTATNANVQDPFSAVVNALMAGVAVLNAESDVTACCLGALFESLPKLNPAGVCIRPRSTTTRIILQC